ncbi:MAG: hypothetical protein PVH93_07490 [Nitrosopumilaceae archaeon]
MRRSYMWGIIAGIWMTINLVILSYWGYVSGDLATWDYEYKFIPFYGFLAGFIPLGIAAYYNHFEEKDKFDGALGFGTTPTYHDIEKTTKYKISIITVSIIGLTLMIIGYQFYDYPLTAFFTIPGIVMLLVGGCLILRMIGMIQDEKKKSENS